MQVIHGDIKDNLFDCIYVINLDSRTDRMKLIDEQFKKIDLEYTRFSALKGTNGVNGCRLSHLAILKEAKEKGYKRILICEDDLVLRKKFIDDIREIVDKSLDCDMLYFHHPQPSDIKPNGTLVCKHQAPWCTHMYAVFNIDNVLEWVSKNDFENRGIDGIYVNSGLNVYMTREEYAFQMPNKSDISNAVEHRFRQMVEFNDLLSDLPKLEETDNVYKQYKNTENPIFILQDMHSGLGDVIMFLSKVIEVSNYFGNTYIKLSNKNLKISLIKEIIPMIRGNTFEWVDEDYTICYGWGDYGGISKYFECKDEFKWKPIKSNVLSFQLDGANWQKELKNCSEADIAFFKTKFKDKVLIDIHKIFDFDCKVSFLLKSEYYYGIDSGNTHLANLLGVPYTVIENKYIDGTLKVYNKKNIKQYIYEAGNIDF